MRSRILGRAALSTVTMFSDLLRRERERCGLRESAAEGEVLAEFRGYLSRRISNAVAVLREEVPTEAWPRVAAGLEAVGLLPHAR